MTENKRSERAKKLSAEWDAKLDELVAKAYRNGYDDALVRVLTFIEDALGQKSPRELADAKRQRRRKKKIARGAA